MITPVTGLASPSKAPLPTNPPASSPSSMSSQGTNNRQCPPKNVRYTGQGKSFSPPPLPHPVLIIHPRSFYCVWFHKRFPPSHVLHTRPAHSRANIAEFFQGSSARHPGVAEATRDNRGPLAEEVTSQEFPGSCRAPFPTRCAPTCAILPWDAATAGG